MEEYKRKSAIFSLCGLNCCLCPRFHMDGASACPGCGGDDFSAKHPSCAVITCSKKHGFVEYCFACASYPCPRYQKPSETDSFISYKNVLPDQKAAKDNLGEYLKELTEKQEILRELISNYNDGRSKGFYCLAVNLLPLSALGEIMDEIRADVGRTRKLIKEKADSLNIELLLRK